MDMEKTYELEFYGEKHNIVLGKTSYCGNDTLAVLMIEVLEDGTEEDWGTLTVNIADSDFMADETSFAFIDTNNNGKDIVNWLKKNKIAKDTGLFGFSGFCAYPLFSFTKKALDGMRVL